MLDAVGAHLARSAVEAAYPIADAGPASGQRRPEGREQLAVHARAVRRAPTRVRVAVRHAGGATCTREAATDAGALALAAGVAGGAGAAEVSAGRVGAGGAVQAGLGVAGGREEGGERVAAGARHAGRALAPVAEVDVDAPPAQLARRAGALVDARAAQRAGEAGQT